MSLECALMRLLALSLLAGSAPLGRIGLSLLLLLLPLGPAAGAGCLAPCRRRSRWRLRVLLEATERGERRRGRRSRNRLVAGWPRQHVLAMLHAVGRELKQVASLEERRLCD